MFLACRSGALKRQDAVPDQALRRLTLTSRGSFSVLVDKSNIKNLSGSLSPSLLSSLSREREIVWSASSV